MAANQILFSKYIGNLGEADSLFIQLSTDTELAVKNINPIRFQMMESFSCASPIIIFEFTDGNGDLFHHYKPTPDMKFYLDIGTSLITSKRTTLRYSKTAIINQKAGSADQLAYKIFFVHEGWAQMLSTRHSRAWKDNEFCHIVSELAAEAGLTAEINETNRGDFVQPHWTNLSAIKYLTNKSMSPNGGHMEYGTTVDGRFIFKTTGDMIKEQRNKAINKQIPVLVMEGNIKDEATRNSDDVKNKAPTNFYTFNIEEDYLNGVVSGGGGVSAMWYDSTNDNFHIDGIKYSQGDSPQMSEWSAIGTVDENAGVRLYGGRDPLTAIEGVNQNVDLVDSVSRADIVTEKTLNVHIGDMIEILIPVPPSIQSTVPQNIYYSGFYLVCGVESTLNFANSTMNSKLSLMREGYDGKDLSGMARSRAGKFV